MTRTRTFRPAVETLETRDVPSVVTQTVTITDPYGSSGTYTDDTDSAQFSGNWYAKAGTLASYASALDNATTTTGSFDAGSWQSAADSSAGACDAFDAAANSCLSLNDDFRYSQTRQETPANPTTATTPGQAWDDVQYTRANLKIVTARLKAVTADIQSSGLTVGLAKYAYYNGEIANITNQIQAGQARLSDIQSKFGAGPFGATRP